VIRSAERMTYTNVHLLLEGDAALRERYAPLVARFELMQELALILNRKRVRRGSIDFDLPEPLIEFDEFGAMTGVTRAPRNIAHRLIEEFMLAANEAVASHLEEHAGGVDLPHPREARPQARAGIRGSGRAFRLFAGRGRDSGEAIRYTDRPARRLARSAKR
jgi:ribonuclease R